MKRYRVIYADPPWPEISVESKGRTGTASKHYSLMTEHEILDMRNFVQQLSDSGCALLLWTTSRHIPFALCTMETWGFRYVNVAFTWMKSNKKKGTPFMGHGYTPRRMQSSVYLEYMVV